MSLLSGRGRVPPWRGTGRFFTDVGGVRAGEVTNDRFREWIEDHPAVTEPGFLVKGAMRDGVGEGGVNLMIRARTHPTLAADSTFNRKRVGKTLG